MPDNFYKERTTILNNKLFEGTYEEEKRTQGFNLEFSENTVYDRTNGFDVDSR
jgi:hypothetical protein